ncbi:hypothetical protein BJV78DRAFT_1278928 [Lactifluus subvellereus]|nr:hypothetical protein BJV78DRAFT_1278928 [Lactifluus subvellereus]
MLATLVRGFEDPVPSPVPNPVTELTSPLLPAGLLPVLNVSSARTLATQVGRPPRVAALSSPPSLRTTPLTSSAPSERAASPGASAVASPVLNTGGMTKEGKAVEMARRKEESSRIAQFRVKLKEQKEDAAGLKA